MRFMVIVKATERSEAGIMPTSEELERMGKFNEEMVKAGVMLAGDGLKPTSQGLRISFAGQKPTVIDGPFAETKELLAGFWIIQVKSREDAIAWMSRAPFYAGETIEIRPFYEMEDFGPVSAQQESALLDQIAKQHG